MIYLYALCAAALGQELCLYAGTFEECSALIRPVAADLRKDDDDAAVWCVNTGVAIGSIRPRARGEKE